MYFKKIVLTLSFLFCSLTTLWAQNYTISANADPSEGGTISGTGIYAADSSVSLTAVPNQGYSFSNWTENSIAVSTDSNYLFIASADRDLTANFELDSFTVILSAEPENGGTLSGGGTYGFGDEVTATASALDGYTFVNWTESGAEVSADSLFSFKAEENRMLTANFSLNNYLITAEANPMAGGIVTGAGSFDAGDSVKLIAVPADGYYFVHWTENENIVHTDSIYSFAAAGNRALKAEFTFNQYTVTTSAVPEEGGTTAGDSLYSHGTLVNVTAAPAEGWKFDNWSNDTNILSGDTSYSFVIFKEQNLYAYFSKNLYQVETSAVPEEGGTVTGNGLYAYDSLVTLSAVPSAGWNFLYWTQSDTLLSNDSVLTFNAESEINLEAHFAKNIYQITADLSPENGGLLFGDSVYTHGDTVNLIASPDSLSGYDFVMWIEDGNQVSDNPVLSFTADKNRSLQAVFQLRNYQVELIALPLEGGEVRGIGQYVHGDSVTVEAQVNEGWLFANWTDGEVNISSDPVFTFAITDNKNLTANFAHELYTVICVAEPSDAGIISGSGSFYYGQTAVLTPHPNMGWEFKNWTQNGSVISTDTVLTVNVTENMNIQANYDVKYYSISCSSNPIEAGTTIGCGLSNYDQQMIVEAVAHSGWEFINWTENGEVVSSSVDYAFNVSGSRDLVANFELLTGIEKNDAEIIPDNFYLSNAYPNPFNPSTKLNFGLPEESLVNVMLFNINGEKVREIISNMILPAGNYKSSLDADGLASGLYLYVFLAQSENTGKNFKKIEKLVLLK